MPDTRKRVQIITGHYPEMPDQPVVLVDGEPLRSVSRIEIDHTNHAGRPPEVRITLLGVDVDMNIGADPTYYVQVIGPRSRTSEPKGSKP